MSDQDQAAPGAATEQEARSRAFRRAMAQAPAGVTVTTADDGAAAHGVTVSSFTSVSLDPQLCLVCVNGASALLPILRRARRFAVHVLAEDQAPLARLFASASAEERLAQLTREAGQPPRLSGFLTRFTFSLWEERPAGDHSVVIGAVERIETAAGDADRLGEAAFEGLPPALTWWRSRMGSLAPRGGS